MNEIVNKLLLTGDMFILSLHLRHLEFTYSPFGLFTKQFQNFKTSKKQVIHTTAIKTN